MTPTEPGLSAVHLQQAWTSEEGPRLKRERAECSGRPRGFGGSRLRSGSTESTVPPAKLRLLRPYRCSPLSTPKPPWSREPLPPPSLASSDRLVLSPTAATPLPTPQAGAQRQVAAHAGHEERQGQEGQPAGTAKGVRVAPHRVITRARLPELPLRV